MKNLILSILSSKPPRTEERGYYREVLTGLILSKAEFRQGLFDNSPGFQPWVYVRTRKEMYEIIRVKESSTFVSFPSFSFF